MKNNNVMKKKGLSVTPGKNQFVKVVDGVPILMFIERGIPVQQPEKKWFNGIVTRRVFDSKDELIDKVVQKASVYSTEEDAPGLIFRRCPDPFAGKDPGGRVTTTQSMYEAGSDSKLT